MNLLQRISLPDHDTLIESLAIMSITQLMTCGVAPQKYIAVVLCSLYVVAKWRKCRELRAKHREFMALCDQFDVIFGQLKAAKKAGDAARIEFHLSRCRELNEMIQQKATR